MASQAFDLYKEGLKYYANGDLVNSINCLRKCFSLNIYYLKKLLFDNRFNLLKETEEFKKLVKPTKVFEINEFLTLKLIFSNTLIFVCGDLFITCQKAVLNLVLDDCNEYRDFDNIDDIIDFYKSHSVNGNISITPEEEFWAHCSNMQAWVENNYSSNILSRGISFPILKDLIDKRFLNFKNILKEEIIKQVKRGGIKSLVFFIEERYLSYLTEDDFFDNFLVFEDAEVIRGISMLVPLDYMLTTNLKDSRDFYSLRVDNKLHFCVENGHITELEILLNNKTYTNKYYNALLQVKNLKYLRELAIYYSEDIEIHNEKFLEKILYQLEDLHEYLLLTRT